MKNKKIQIFDTTLRDGTQAEKISFSSEDKIHIAQRLDKLGVDYIEGGWPGSNPKDMEFFEKIKDVKLENSKIVAFGSTKHARNKIEDDKNIQALIDADTPVVSVFGKSWILHVEKALKISPEKNLDLIRESVSYLKKFNKEVIFDAEHFFDGYKDDPEYAMETLKVAEKSGADLLALCDTNGGTLTSELIMIIDEVKEKINIPLGIHAHNDSGLAVANSISAVESGCIQVQGTINGFGERSGNADLCSVIPNLQLKANYDCIPQGNMKTLTSLSRYLNEVANLSHPNNLPFTGKSAFAHKGGIHVSAVIKEPRSYEHIKPEEVGNRRRVLVSDLSGKSNINFKADELNIDIEKHKDKIPEIVERLKNKEYDGFQYEAAEGSLELLIQKVNNEFKEYFNLKGFRILIEKDESGATRSEATIRVSVGDTMEHTASEGHGPINALDNALRKALMKFYPEIDVIKLSDYKVRVLNAKDATASKVRVLIDSKSKEHSWGTVGVHANIIEASWQALTESVLFYLMKNKSENKNLK
ncbi:MAG: citramalate synthase [Candidatus Marinimicrobia bacterium]|nr:citramalate synthase [Candidatus Neomarinimicrobiota bacterium]